MLLHNNTVRVTERYALAWDDGALGARPGRRSIRHSLGTTGRSLGTTGRSLGTTGRGALAWDDGAWGARAG